MVIGSEFRFQPFWGGLSIEAMEVVWMMRLVPNTQTRTMRVRCVPVRTDDRPVAFISMMIMEERIIIGRLQGCPRPEELCSLWNTVVRLTLSVHFVVIRVNFASEQLADVIAREAVSRHGGASDSYFRLGYPHHVNYVSEGNFSKFVDTNSSEQTKSYADRRRSDLEFHVRKRVLLKVSPWKEVICSVVKRREPGLCRKTGCCTRKEHEEATEQENRNH
ncbi:hypothetical protein OSB04_024795 [Centaurea solstitialis]|uniref:Uncharacterized protein n=1 Tax=Centaurea solstitialis TaxID=347529 RepID=A0AA38SUC1_9ASTR|nr:hypothetical protein OSB04_024795 [Centaurea solstitialis]